jgi:hypothetical protein
MEGEHGPHEHKEHEKKEPEHKQEHAGQHAHKQDHEPHKHHHDKKLSLLSTETTIILAAILVLIVGLNVVIAAGILAPKTTSGTAAVPPAPVEIQLTAITASGCPQCFDLTQYMTGLSQLQGVTVTSQKTLGSDSAEAQGLISQYSITKIPTIVVTGAVDDPAVSDILAQIGEPRQGAIVLTQLPPPYFDLQTSEIVGLVSFTAIEDSTCDDCVDIDDILSQIRSVGVLFSENTTLDYSSPDAKSLITRYNITRLPALIISSDLGAYSIINTSWPNIGTVEPDGAYIWRDITPPFKEISSGKVRGLVDVVYFVDKSCTDCYNVSMHRNILVNSFRVSIKSEITHDISSTQGSALVAKYNITKVPTFVMSKEAEVYSSLSQVWPSVGTQEPDGWFVFRNIEALGSVTYFDLEAGQTVTGGQ